MDTPETNSQALTTTNSTITKAVVPIGTRGLVLSDLEGLWRFSVAVSKSGLAPKGIQSTEAICVAIQMGLEVGLTPMAALQNIAVINGRPSLWGDAQLAVVRGTGELEEFEEWYEDRGARLPRNPADYTDATTAVCRVKRRGYKPHEVSFSVADAKRANLWSKDGPWRQYPARMLKMRARAFALRDEFGDSLRGMLSAEERMGSSIDIEASVSPNPTFTPPTTIETPSVQDAPKARRGRQRKNQSEQLEPERQVLEQAQAPEVASADEERIVSPPVPEEPPQQISASPQEMLAQIVNEAGFDWELFRRWADESGWIKDADSLASWAEIPTSVADRLVRSKTGLIAMLNKWGQP